MMLSLHASTAVTARTSTDAQLSGRRATSTSTARARVASRRHAMPTRMVFTPDRPATREMKEGMQALEDKLLMQWSDKLVRATSVLCIEQGKLKDKEICKQRATCCYCGPDAGEAALRGEACSLSCICAWELAGTLVQEHSHEAPNAAREEDLIWADRNFLEIIADQPDNQVLLADYALFLWRQRRDYNGTEAMLTRALAAPHQNEMVRLKILNLYSLFMSITPPSATNLEKQRKMLEEPQ